MRNKVLATVVTFNRKELLDECIVALKMSELDCDILIVDNASTDGTEQSVAVHVDNSKIYYKNTGQNLGGAGGFNFALRQGVELGYDYIWIMDDDTIVHPDSLSKLMKAADKLGDKFGFLSSHVAFTDGEVCLMNVPGLEEKFWYEGLNYDVNLIRINRATFVSTLIPTEIIKEKGLPIKDFFIWSDDTEYTRRISANYPCYYVTDSVVTHKMAVNAGVNKNQFIQEDTQRVYRFFYSFRNTMYLRRKAGIFSAFKYTIKLSWIFLSVLLTSKKLKGKKLALVLKGFWAGIFFNPSIEYVQKD